MKVYIETKRLRIRELLESDLEGMFALDSDPEVHKYLGNKPVKTKAEALDIIKNIRQQYVERGIGRWAVIEKETNAFVGWSGMRFYSDYTYNNHTNFYDIGYRFIKRFWGKGYATESARACLAYAFNTMNLDIIYAATEMENEASHHVLLKIGLNYIEDFYFDDEGNELLLRWYTLKRKDYLHGKNNS